jgi:hypothetical protein
MSDYQSSGVGTFTLNGNPPGLFFGSQLGGDPALASSNGRQFFAARDTGTIFELDRCGRGTKSFSPIQSGDPSVDPQDVAVLPDGSLLIPRFLVSSAIVLDPSGSARATIDLAALDPDGHPDMSAATTVSMGGRTKALVVLERLDHHTTPPLAKRTALLAVIDAMSLAVETSIDLGVRNPFGLVFRQDDSTVWLAAAGNFSAANEPDAGVVRFDASTRTATLVIPEGTLGGSPVEVAIEGQCGAVIIADATPVNRTSVVLFDAQTGTVVGTAIPPTAGFDLLALAWANPTTLVVGDRRQVAGSGFPVHVLTRSGSCEVTPMEDLFLPLPAIAFRP